MCQYIRNRSTIRKSTLHSTEKTVILSHQQETINTSWWQSRPIQWLAGYILPYITLITDLLTLNDKISNLAHKLSYRLRQDGNGQSCYPCIGPPARYLLNITNHYNITKFRRTRNIIQNSLGSNVPNLNRQFAMSGIFILRQEWWGRSRILWSRFKGLSSSYFSVFGIFIFVYMLFLCTHMFQKSKIQMEFLCKVFMRI